MSGLGQQHTFVHFKSTVEVRDQKTLVAVAIQIGQTHAVLIRGQRCQLRFEWSSIRMWIRHGVEFDRGQVEISEDNECEIKEKCEK